MAYSASSKAARWVVIAGAALPLSLLVMTVQGQEKSQWGGGKNLYDKVCRHCHSPEVGVGTVLAGRELPAAYVTVIVRNGFNAMPAFPASFIDDKSIAQVAEYLSKLPPPPAKP